MTQQDRINLFVEMLNQATRQTGVMLQATPVIRPGPDGKIRIDANITAEVQFQIDPNWQPNPPTTVGQTPSEDEQGG